jgi:hypothetical protein
MPSNSRELLESPEELDTRCPRLGGTVPFRYCMAPGESTPCYKILDCWWEIFDVTSYLKARLPEEALHKLFEDRVQPNRLNTILELIAKYKKTEPGQQDK